MQKVFDEVGSLDKRCYEEFDLSEDLLMENAARGMAEFIQNNFPKNSKILIVSGNGNNGADGIALGRMLLGGYKVELCIPLGVKSEMAKLQLARAQKVHLPIIENMITSYDVIVECIFGSGFNKPLDDKLYSFISELNTIKAYKIACDFPTLPYKADTTFTMGSLKKRLFLDSMKDYIGEIVVVNLGLSRELYETDTDSFLLDKSDMQLPIRKKLSSHKGNFGHLSVILGNKKGAGLISCEAGFAFGAGLVTAITKDINLPIHIMQSEVLPKNTTAIAIGMGIGNNLQSAFIDNEIPKIIDADLFYDVTILDLLEQKNIVLTPHPKEFCSLLEICGFGKVSISQLQENRFYYVEIFSMKYPHIVLLLKGANVLIAQNQKIFINTFGTSKLSFGGSGDVLSGLIGSLLAQKYTPLESAITASLAHSLASVNYNLNDYSMKPQDLIEEIKKL